ncbi:MAG: tRNA epoxyqueuosine(34) reductase QueG [Betaproteobacteria bacterium]|jgi:epoxyqueuosine reductase|nr:tRNA epoxyqueuosine(34) reductase QueG [Rhodocyclaceae bacterium]MCA3143024.1 tRNA epoxyqueuosine(34) reductase QueG [Rhodocyclaceae bacterium]MCE2898228.1 tRNA epoxyqueuosine(34) reductase QueG [Betaproteobacteria bacterium]
MEAEGAQQGEYLVPADLPERIRAWGRALGFDAVGITGVDLAEAEPGLRAWLEAGFHGAMDWMQRHGMRRARPAELVPGTVSVISARMNYLDASAAAAPDVLAQPELGYVSRYALGRDYHKVLRQRLQRLAGRVAEAVGPFGYRVFTDSAPVLEVELATRAGLGWRGKHTLLLDRDAGSFFFLGEIYTDLPLPADAPVSAHCGSCTRCMEVCPTGAIVAPYRLDARRCISYLTIEHPGDIPEALRPLLGNRVYGCDDCQLFCPWNRYARPAGVADFQVRNGLDAATLVELFGWSEAQFTQRLAGSAIVRIGHERWLRNLTVGLGNAPPSEPARRALRARADHPSALVRRHVAWALARQAQTAAPG